MAGQAAAGCDCLPSPPAPGNASTSESSWWGAAQTARSREEGTGLCWSCGAFRSSPEDLLLLWFKGKSYGKRGTEAVPSHRQPLLYNTGLIPGRSHAQPLSSPLGAATPSSAGAGSSVPGPHEVVWGGWSGSVLHFPIMARLRKRRPQRQGSAR